MITVGNPTSIWNIAAGFAAGAWLAGGFPLPAVPAAAGAPAAPPAIARYVAVDNVCAWPMLVTLRDGAIVAIIHNRPSHGGMAGDVECWASRDGVFWEKRGHPAPNDPHTVRMNVGTGLARNGDLLVLCSGWTDEKQPERPKQGAFRDAVVPIWVCRSADGGRTWTQRKEFPANERGWSPWVPFGPIVAGADGALHTSCYAGELTEPAASFKMKGWRSAHIRSDDDGRTWGAPVRLATSLEQDCGYPSSGQRADGKIVTVYYAKRVENHERYHMGAAIWEAPAK